jgi:hypothetical protein
VIFGQAFAFWMAPFAQRKNEELTNLFADVRFLQAETTPRDHY